MNVKDCFLLVLVASVLLVKTPDMCRAKFLAVTFVLVAFVRHTDCWRRRRRRSPPPCTPRDCQVSLWSAWSACTHQCGTSGTQIRTRTVAVPAACGGSCSFALSETRLCNRDKCQNSGTPIASGCLCQAGFSGTCCEIADATTPPPTVTPPFTGCGGMLNGSSGSFATPGYPMLYFNNLDCTWTLRIPADNYLRLKFVVFHTEQCCDFVELIDNTGQIIEDLRGFKPLYTVIVDGNRTDTLRVRFDSDSSVRRRGLLAQYHISPLPPNISTTGVPFTTPVTASPALTSTMSDTTTLATALPALSSAPLMINTTVYTVEPSTPNLTPVTSSPVMSSSVVPPVILPPDVQRLLVDILSSVSQIVQKLTGLVGKPAITPADFESFRNETLQILQQIENQLLTPTPTQASNNQQIAKRAIPDKPDLQELVQILEGIQRKLLG